MRRFYPMDLITHALTSTVEFEARVNNYMSLFYADVITYIPML